MRFAFYAFVLTGGLVIGSNAGYAQENDLAKYCKPDIERLCAATQPGGGRLLKCLKSHQKEISVGCAQALQKMKG